MTSRILSATLTGAFAVGVLALAPGGPAQAEPAASTSSAPRITQDRQWDQTFYSSAPGLTATDGTAARATPAARPKPPATKGVVTGQVVGPQGTPIRNALVVGIRYSDLGLPVDLSEEKRVLARTDRSGHFRLRQLREGYLVRVCSELASSDGGGHRGKHSGECDYETTKRFTPSYVGPDGTSNSWLRQTRLFKPQRPGRNLGRVVVQPPAVITGTFKGGPNRLVYLTRTDHSVAEQTITDDNGNYRFEVAPGPYRVEADRDEGLRTDSTVPGYRSARLVPRGGRTLHLSFRTRHAGIVRGLVTSGGTPLPDQFLSILDEDGDFAAGVVTNDIGRYVVSSLEPGKYTVTTSYSASSYVPVSKPVAVSQKGVATADLALSPGSSLSFFAVDVGGTGVVDAELRNADGRVVKVYQGAPALEQGAQVTFSGLAPAPYRLYVRRAVNITDGPEQTDFPWATRSIDLTLVNSANLGAVTLDQPTVNLTGTIPRRSEIKITAVPEDAYLRESHIDGDQVTPMALNWTEVSDSGDYTVRGLVPGTYTVAITTARREREDKPSTTGGNIATTHSTVTIDSAAPTASFTAPEGAKVRGTMRYATNNRPVIAPFGFRVADSGDQSWLFPTVSGPQKYGKSFRVERLHAGRATGRLLDLDALYDEHPDVLIPDTLVSSARTAERATSYWMASPKKTFKLREGQVLDLGVLKVNLHGVLGVQFGG